MGDSNPADSRRAMRLVVVVPALIATALALCANESRHWSPSPGTLVIDERLGKDDSIELYVKGTPSARDSRALLQLMADAGLRAKDTESLGPHGDDRAA
jgi:hypothetical protein